MLNLVFNALCGGTCLQDIDLRRGDRAFLDGLGVSSLPDPRTARDFCRRFDNGDVMALQEAISAAGPGVGNPTSQLLRRRRRFRLPVLRPPRESRPLRSLQPLTTRVSRPLRRLRPLRAFFDTGTHKGRIADDRYPPPAN